MIPVVTNPLGKYWDQPDREKILVDDKHAVMTKETYNQLAHYEISIPSGTYEGKMWRRGNQLCWFEDKSENEMWIRIREILIVE